MSKLWLRRLSQHALPHASVPTAKRLQGKVAVVTGGSGGIGRAVTRLFRQEGAKVVIADISNKCTEREGEDLTYVHCDVTNEDHVRGAVETAVAKYGRLDIMLNNAGVADCSDGPQSIRRLDYAELMRVLTVNVAGCALGIKHAAAQMVRTKGHGSIICTASISGVVGGGPHAYTASKHAILGLVKNAAAELGQQGIRVNAVSPFCVPTELVMRFFKAVGGDSDFDVDARRQEAYAACEEYVEGMANLKGVGLSANDVAEAAVFLGSDASRYVSGHNLVVDGGFTVCSHKLGALEIE